MRKNESQKIALCGVLGALSVVCLLAGAALQIGTYAAPMLASFLLIPVLEEYGARYALLLYATTAVLGLLLVPETELALFYALVVGYYPVLRHALRRVKPAVLRWAVKLARLQCRHGAGVFFIVCPGGAGHPAGNAGGRTRYGGIAAGHGQSILLFVRPCAGGRDDLLSPRAAQTGASLFLTVERTG